MKKLIIIVVFSVFMSGCSWSDLVRVFVDLREDVAKLSNEFESSVPKINELCASASLKATCDKNDVSGAVLKIRGYLADANHELSQENQDAAEATYQAAKIKVDGLKLLLGL